MFMARHKTFDNVTNNTLFFVTFDAHGIMQAAGACPGQDHNKNNN